MTDIAMIYAAEARHRGQVRRTLLRHAPLLGLVAGRRIFRKAECLPRTGRFKCRGGWSAVARARGLMAYPSGNHAQGGPLVILMPSEDPAVKIVKTRAISADVITADRDTTADALSAERGFQPIKPFDDAFVIAGQGKIGLEIAGQAAEAGITQAPVLTACGVGMTRGIAFALRVTAPDLRVHPVEPKGCDNTAPSLASRRIEVNLRAAGWLRDAIVTPSPGFITFAIRSRPCRAGLVVAEEHALRATPLAAAAALNDGSLPDTVIALGSGGNVDPGLSGDTQKRFG